MFKKIVISLANALKIIHEKGVMHRDIKPYNIFIREEDGKQEIKLGNFRCSLFIKDNISEPIGTILYCAPEIIKNLEYDEKCDLWSLGITLFELYFDFLPYGDKVNINKIKNYIYNPKNFIFKKSNIPSLDILFKRLLVIDPKDRMNFDEFFDYVLNDNFMKEGIIYVNDNPKYKEIYKIIQNEPQIEFDNIVYEGEYDFEYLQVKNKKNILSFVERDHLTDIMNFSNGEINNDGKYNNIIYYDENIEKFSEKNQDSDFFERKTPGAFLLCTNLDSLQLISKEIIRKIKKDKRIIFNLITTGSKCDKIMGFLNDNENRKFKDCIKNICIYCMNLKKWGHLKEKYPIVQSVCTKLSEVIYFIDKNASTEIKPFHITKLITLNNYLGKYKERHFQISKYYGDLTTQSYKDYLEKIKLMTEEDKKRILKYEKFRIFNFDIEETFKVLDKLISQDYQKYNFYGDINNSYMFSRINSYEIVAYFTARLMYYVNKYANLTKIYYNENNKKLYKGVQLTYSCLLPYERAKGKVIVLSSFTSACENIILSNQWAGRGEELEIYNNTLKFSVLFIITNHYKNEWVSNGIILNESIFNKEKEIVYQPFSFYYVRDVKIDTSHYTADIYLETIGKTEILEEQIRQGKEIKYNKNDNLIQIKK